MEFNTKRSAGILLHPTSLPGPHGIGAIGAHAKSFVDFLHNANQSLWQILPLGPTGYGDSPYASTSTFAGNPLLIDLDVLADEGLISRGDLSDAPPSCAAVDFGWAIAFKAKVLRLATDSFASQAASHRVADLRAFIAKHAWWLDDYALFDSLKHAYDGRPFYQWDVGLRHREPSAIELAKVELAEEIQHRYITQFLFFEQWNSLLNYAHSRGVRIIGDVPIFVAMDSDAVWSRPELFKLGSDLTPSVVAGVPPDYFSEAGQLWGNPLYDWDAHALEGFDWWISRLAMALSLTDIVRLDHFRGFEAAWEIPAHHTDARGGEWVTGPGDSFFDALREKLGGLPLIAEDLGVITDEVRALRDRHRLPGMHVLQFGFDPGEDRIYAPHRAIPNTVVYTGTHDNDTTNGWFRTLPSAPRELAKAYLGADGDSIHWPMIRAAYGTVANTVIIPMQDVLGLGSEVRMNTPGQVGLWWTFRLVEQPRDAVAAVLRELTILFER